MEDLQSEHPGRSGSDAVHTAPRCPGRHIVARHRAPARRQPSADPKPHDNDPVEPCPGEPEPTRPGTAPAPSSGEDAGTGRWRSLLRAATDRLGRWRDRDASDETPEQGWTVRFTSTWHDWD